MSALPKANQITDKFLADAQKTYGGRYPRALSSRIKEALGGEDSLRKNQNLKAKYGISLLAKKIILKKQKNLCVICSKKLPFEEAVIDHDHETGKVRGILCVACNTGIGLLKDDITVLKSAITYLLLHKENGALSQEPSENSDDPPEANSNSSSAYIP